MTQRLYFFFALALLFTTACSSSGGDDDDDEADAKPIMEAGKLLIEHNATDEDTGFQAFADGDAWDELVISGPAGPIMRARPDGSLSGFGLTEFFFETSEPENAEVAIPKLLERLPEGTYTFTGKMVGGAETSVTATLTHTIPAGPEFVSPEDDEQGVDPNETTVTWQPVTETYDGSSDVQIVAYQVIVEKVLAVDPNPEGFAQPNFSVYLPASATSVKIPPEFMQDDTPYSCEVLAIEESGNQTLSSIHFSTGSADEPPENEPSGVLTSAKLLIEHNATDKDTGFQGFVDGDPWTHLTIDPDAPIVDIDALGSFDDFGVTELFFETEEPANEDVPIPQVLSRIPEGPHVYSGEMVGGGASTVTATFTHKIPAGPLILTPAAGAKQVDPATAVVEWQSVKTDINGASINIVGYEVIVEEEEATPRFPQTFAQPVLDVHVPTNVTRLSIPENFLEPGAPYTVEVLAIEESGNQTLSQRSFETK